MTIQATSLIWEGKPAERAVARITLQDALWYPLQYSGEIVQWFLRNENAANGLDVTFDEDPRTQAVVNFFTLDPRTGNLHYLRENSRPKAIWVRRTVADQIVYFEFIKLTAEEDVS